MTLLGLVKDGLMTRIVSAVLFWTVSREPCPGGVYRAGFAGATSGPAAGSEYPSRNGRADEGLTGRQNLHRLREIYNVYSSPPQKEGLCDKDGGKLEQRAERQRRDNPAALDGLRGSNQAAH